MVKHMQGRDQSQFSMHIRGDVITVVYFLNGK